ncbi:MAG: NAD(P)H nitroreductase [Clostridiaceae bacterium]|nr:NAD(P)H nitroreductase [Clostridiaceae bacterium]
MDFIELTRIRQSVRRYSGTPVEREKIEKCIEAARLAPSACNSQPWRIVVVDDPEIKEEVARETYGPVISFNKFTHTAPVILVMVMEKPNITAAFGAAVKNIDYSSIDLGIAAEHICLQAAELGLGTCMLGWFNEEPIKKILGIPRERKIGLLICLGYPENKEVRKKVRRPFNEIVSYNKYAR